MNSTRNNSYLCCESGSQSAWLLWIWRRHGKQHFNGKESVNVGWIKGVYLVSIHKWSFCPISALESDVRARSNVPLHYPMYACGYFSRMPWFWTKILIYGWTLFREEVPTHKRLLPQSLDQIGMPVWNHSRTDGDIAGNSHPWMNPGL